jgi:hypothetical protein
VLWVEEIELGLNNGLTVAQIRFGGIGRHEECALCAMLPQIRRDRVFGHKVLGLNTNGQGATSTFGGVECINLPFVAVGCDNGAG